MNETVKKFRKTMGRLGAVLLLFTLMLYGSAMVVKLLSEILKVFMGGRAFVVITSLMSAGAYLASFTLAAWFYHLAQKEPSAEPIRFAPVLPKRSFLIVFAGVACTLSMAMVNSVAANFLGLAEAEELFKLPNEFSADYNIVLQFISLALVPAFCEEILFRGVVLSNLMPYGKASAIVISSVLFGLMHGNFYQFLYATAAGLVMGCVYVLTESIWCSILLHFINNTVSVLQTAVLDRFSEEHSVLIIIVYECILIFVGIVCAFALVAGKKQTSGGIESIGFSRNISPRDSAKGFLIPTVLSFCVISIIFGFVRFT